MITAKEIDKLFKELQKGPNQKIRDEFNLKTIKYFIQELKKIINDHSSAEKLRLFHLNFEVADYENSDVENCLDEKVLDLYLMIGDKPSKKELNELLKKAKGFLKEIKEGRF